MNDVDHCCLFESNKYNSNHGQCERIVSKSVWSSKVKRAYEMKKMKNSTLSKNDNVHHSNICEYHKKVVTKKTRTVGPVRIAERKRVKASALGCLL